MMSSRPSSVRGQSRNAVPQQTNASTGVANKNTRGAGMFGSETQTHPLKQECVLEESQGFIFHRKTNIMLILIPSKLDVLLRASTANGQVYRI